jgi:hypothetical protein
MKNFFLKYARRLNRKNSINNLKNAGIYDQIKLYLSKTSSTGISWSDFWVLYNFVRLNKPKSVLECGPGASTLVISLALEENEKDGYPGSIIAMEEMEKYLELSIKLLPKNLHRYVKFILSPRIDDYYEIFRGVRYRDIPNEDFDFVFIDGPEHISISDNQFCFDFDFLYVLKNNNRPLQGIIDYRLSTGFVLQTILGLDIVQYDIIKEIGIIKPCSINDARFLELEALKYNFDNYSNLFSKNKIKIYR